MKCPAIFVKVSSIALAVYIPHASTYNTNVHILCLSSSECVSKFFLHYVYSFTLCC